MGRAKNEQPDYFAAVVARRGLGHQQLISKNPHLAHEIKRLQGILEQQDWSSLIAELSVYHAYFDSIDKYPYLKQAIENAVQALEKEVMSDSLYDYVRYGLRVSGAAIDNCAPNIYGTENDPTVLHVRPSDYTATPDINTALTFCGLDVNHKLGSVERGLWKRAEQNQVPPITICQICKQKAEENQVKELEEDNELLLYDPHVTEQATEEIRETIYQGLIEALQTKDIGFPDSLNTAIEKIIIDHIASICKSKQGQTLHDLLSNSERIELSQIANGKVPYKLDDLRQWSELLTLDDWKQALRILYTAEPETEFMLGNYSLTAVASIEKMTPAAIHEAIFNKLKSRLISASN